MENSEHVHPEILQCLIDAHPGGLLDVDDDGKTPLHKALVKFLTPIHNHNKEASVDGNSSTSSRDLTKNDGKPPIPPPPSSSLSTPNHNKKQRKLQPPPIIRESSVALLEHSLQERRHLPIIQALLTPPGENALRVKDSDGNLPLHIASQMGAPANVLSPLIRNYTEGCYRTNVHGDLPLHLLVQSGSATAETVTMLLTPIAENESIQRVHGSRGYVLPLHIAVQYQVPFDVLSKLCKTCPVAARETRQGGGSAEVYALDILEEGREDLQLSWGKEMSPYTQTIVYDRKTQSAADPDDAGDSKMKRTTSNGAIEAAARALEEFNQKSDLVFVYNPDAISRLPRKMLRRGSNGSGEQFTVSHLHSFRKEVPRLKRLESLIQKEVWEIVGSHSGPTDDDFEKITSHNDQDHNNNNKNTERRTLSDTARLAWMWMCTFESRDVDPEDHYADSIRDILDGLSAAGIHYLANIEIIVTSNSPSLANTPVAMAHGNGLSNKTMKVKECASMKCMTVLSDKLRFCGRYEFVSTGHVGFYQDQIVPSTIHHHHENRTDDSTTAIHTQSTTFASTTTNRKRAESCQSGKPVLLHRSEDNTQSACLIVKAIDYGVQQDYLQIKRFIYDAIQNSVIKEEQQQQQQPEVEHTSSPSSSPSSSFSPAGGIPIQQFLTLARKLGYNDVSARSEIMKYMKQTLATTEDEATSTLASKKVNDRTSYTEGMACSGIEYAHIKREQLLNGTARNGNASMASTFSSTRMDYVDASSFYQFCTRHYIDGNGVRNVVFKFMQDKAQFEREKMIRSWLHWETIHNVDLMHAWPNPVVPVLEDFDVDRVVDNALFINRNHVARSCTNGEEKKSMDSTLAMLGNMDIHSKNSNATGGQSVNSVGRSITGRSVMTSASIPTFSGKHGNKDARYAFDVKKCAAVVDGLGSAGGDTMSSEGVAQDLELYSYKYALVLPNGEADLGNICRQEHLDILQIRDHLLQVGNCLQRIHSQGVVHGDLKMTNIIRYHQHHTHLSLIDMGSSYTLKVRHDAQSPHTHNSLFFAGSSRKISTSILPPEMIMKLNSAESQKDNVLMERYHRYWHLVSEDAKDLKLLTPDDIKTISNVVKSLRNKEHNVFSQSPKNQEENEPHWKDQFSTALVTISFDDLPHSLTSCNSFGDFSTAWNRVLTHAALWHKIHPRLHTDGNEYIIKAFRDVTDTYIKSSNGTEAFRDSMDTELLPFQLERATEKLDIWMFGVLIFSLCSGGNLFPSDYNDDLIDTSSFAQLEAWEKKTAENIIIAKVEDPLAQDLLLQLLVPEEDRLASMDLVLRHPFFGPASTLEAQCILEKHEEQQLMIEETTIVQKLTTETQRRLDNSTEKQCKIIFEEEKVVIPTCFIVLPYELKYDARDRRLTIPVSTTANESPRGADDGTANIATAIELGLYLLDINKATARLSFWLMMKKNLSENDGGVFKMKLRQWLQRARTEPGELVAMEIVSDIGCGGEYINICREMLEKGDAVSNARNYIKDPMGAAMMAITQNTEAIMQCYSKNTQYFYLVDEYQNEPVKSNNAGSLDQQSPSYPLQIDPDARLLKKLFLPFMNLAVMVVTAVDGLASLATLLGLPRSHGIPESWKDAEPGLIHRIDQPSSVAEFAVLQDMIKKQEQAASASSQDGDGRPPSGGDTQSSEEGAISEMRKLEIFYREYDPMRTFSDLRRISDGKHSAIWTTDRVVDKIQGEQALASVESRLRELKKEWMKRDRIEEEIVLLTEQLKDMKRPTHESQIIHMESNAGLGFTGPVTSVGTPVDKESTGYSAMNLNTSGRSSSTSASYLEAKKKNKKMRKSSKLRIRPYFGTC